MAKVVTEIRFRGAYVGNGGTAVAQTHAVARYTYSDGSLQLNKRTACGRVAKGIHTMQMAPTCERCKAQIDHMGATPEEGTGQYVRTWKIPTGHPAHRQPMVPLHYLPASDWEIDGLIDAIRQGDWLNSDRVGHVSAGIDDDGHRGHEYAVYIGV